VADAVRAIFWYQGESDGASAVAHEFGFLALCRDWLQDYPSTEKVYFCQIKNGCGTAASSLALRERQRLMADQYPLLSIMSTSAMLHWDDCHFGYEGGYRDLGNNFARLVLRDLYGQAQPSQIDPPNFAYAYSTDGSGSNGTVLTRNPEDQLAYAAMPADFRVEDPASAMEAVVVSGSASNNVIQLDDPYPEDRPCGVLRRIAEPPRGSAPVGLCVAVCFHR